MRTLSSFLEQLGVENTPFNVWEYDKNQQYRPYSSTIKSVKAFNSVLEQRAQWIVEIPRQNDALFYLILPEINAVSPVQFADNRVQSMTHAA
ncbi:MAG: hypothetical protein GY908_14265 [Flavobacteriales bacterium]|nr:hypothetical protein [Flavobacteriales bacterium]